jgi:hypothetical protein
MGDSGSDDVTIKLKHKDWEIEIRCAEPKVKEVVERVLSSIDTSFTGKNTDEVAELRQQIDSLKSAILATPHANNTEVGFKSPVGNDKGGGKTCRGLLETLWIEGYFGSERSLGQVHEELARRGYNYDRTAVSHSLTDMVRESILTRLGSMRNYRYIQKRPASDNSATL